MSNPNTSFTHSFVVPAGGVRPINSGGRFFRVVKTNVPLAIQRSGAAYQPYEQGDAEELADGETFDRLEVKNTAAVDAYVEIYVGYGRREQSRQTVMEPPTRTVGSGKVDLGAETPLVVAPLLLAGDLQRKAVYVTNGDGSNLRLEVRDKSGKALGVILSGESAVFYVSDTIQIYNPNPVAVSVYYGQVYHTA